MGLLQIEPYYNWLALHVFHSMFKGFEIKEIKEWKCQTQKEICQMLSISICAFIERPLFGKYQVCDFVCALCCSNWYNSFHTGKTYKIVPPQQWRCNWTDRRKRGGKKIKILKEWQKRDEGWRCGKNDSPLNFSGHFHQLFIKTLTNWLHSRMVWQCHMKNKYKFIYIAVIWLIILKLTYLWN